MIRLAFLSALVVSAPLAWGQGTVPAARLVQETQPAGHVLSIQNGVLTHDGVVLPHAAPASLDLTGIELDFQYSGPVTPVISIDGAPYVFENERLVPFSESSRVGERVYGLGEPMPVDQASDAAYLQDVAQRDAALYRQIEHEATLEADALRRADRIRGMAPGEERDAAREELRALLSDLLQLMHANRREELSRMQERVDAVRAQLDKRTAMHDAIVDSRLRALCDD